MPYKLSPSTLKIMKECPRCFWLHMNKGIKRPAGIFPSLPSGMDRVLKKHFDSFLDKGKLPPELKGVDASLFKNIELLEIWRNNFKGIQWKDSEGNILKGAVDNILEKDNKLIVLDYKTRGYPLKENTHEFYQDQLDIYNFLLRKNGYETQDYAYLLFYYPTAVDKQGHIIFNTELVKMKVDVENAEKIFRDAIELLKSKIPEAGEDCEWCGWGKIKI